MCEPSARRSTHPLLPQPLPGSSTHSWGAPSTSSPTAAGTNPWEKGTRSHQELLYHGNHPSLNPQYSLSCSQCPGWCQRLPDGCSWALALALPVLGEGLHVGLWGSIWGCGPSPAQLCGLCLPAAAQGWSLCCCRATPKGNSPALSSSVGNVVYSSSLKEKQKSIKIKWKQRQEGLEGLTYEET